MTDTTNTRDMHFAGVGLSSLYVRFVRISNVFTETAIFLWGVSARRVHDRPLSSIRFWWEIEFISIGFARTVDMCAVCRGVCYVAILPHIRCFDAMRVAFSFLVGSLWENGHRNDKCCMCISVFIIEKWKAWTIYSRSTFLYIRFWSAASFRIQPTAAHMKKKHPWTTNGKQEKVPRPVSGGGWEKEHFVALWCCCCCCCSVYAAHPQRPRIPRTCHTRAPRHILAYMWFACAIKLE